MSTLYPVTQPGSTTAPLTYGEGDFIGIEADATDLTDHVGFNEVADWTTRFDTALQREHYPNGVHNTLRVGRCILILDWDGTTMNVGDDSYLQDTSGTVTRGGGVATVNRLGAGDYQITLAHALTTGPTMLVDLTPAEYSAATSFAVQPVHVMRHTYTSTTVFNLRRYQGSGVDTEALADGHIHVILHT